MTEANKVAIRRLYAEIDKGNLDAVIAEEWTVFDGLGMLQQLGAALTPA